MANVRRPGTGFTNIGDLLQLNQGAAQAMTDRLGTRVGEGAGKAQSAVLESANSFTPTTGTAGAKSWQEANSSNLPGWQAGIEDAAARVNALGSAEGRSALMDDYYGRGTTGGRRMDAALSGMVQSPAVKGTQQQFSRIRETLGMGSNIADSRQQNFNQTEAQRQAEEERKRREAEQARQGQEPAREPRENDHIDRSRRARDQWDNTYVP